MKDSLNKTFIFKEFTRFGDSVNKQLRAIKTEIQKANMEEKQAKNKVSPDTAYTVKITLLVFIAGIIIDRSLKKIDSMIKNYRRRKYFRFHINQIQNYFLPKLRDAYSSLVYQTDIDSGITSTPPRVVSSDFQRLSTINYEELFEAYSKNDVLSKVLGQIAFVQKVQDLVEEFHNKVRDDSDKVREQLNAKTDEYMTSLNEYLEWERLNNSDFMNSPTFSLINSLVITYYREFAGSRSLSIFYRQVIRVIQEHIIEIDGHRKHPHLAIVAENGRRLSHLVSTLKVKTTEILDQYEVFSKYTEDARLSLQTHVPTLK